MHYKPISVLDTFDCCALQNSKLQPERDTQVLKTYPEEISEVSGALLSIFNSCYQCYNKTTKPNYVKHTSKLGNWQHELKSRKIIYIYVI